MTWTVPSSCGGRYQSLLATLWLLLGTASSPHALTSDCPDRTGVDLILQLRSQPLNPRAPNRDVYRKHLAVLERQFARGGQFTSDPSIVFFQLLHPTSGRNADEVDHERLTLAVESFAYQHYRGCTIFRLARPADLLASTIESAGRMVLVLLLLPDLTSLSQVLLKQVARVFPRATNLILLISGGADECLTEEEVSTVRTVISVLWRVERVHNVIAVWYRCSATHEMTMGWVDPYPSDTTKQNETNFIVSTSLDSDALPIRLQSDHRMNLNRKPLDIYGFDAAMAYRRKDIDMLPRTFPQLATPGLAPTYLDELFGADVESLRELAIRLNFTPRLHHTRANFGFRSPNGSFTGVLGHLVTTRDSWFSMNVYFLKDYETRDVQFTAAVYQDSLCVFVKAAGMLPDWLLIFRCFTPTLWLVVWSTVALVSLLYVVLAQLLAVHRLATLQSNGCNSQGTEGSLLAERKLHALPFRLHPLERTNVGSWNRLPISTAPFIHLAAASLELDTVGMIGQIAGALLSAPTNGINRTTAHQKLFLTFGLLWGMTMTGAFQGSLVEVYTTPTSMKNLETLAELDASRLPVVVGAPALIVDVFGNERPGNTIGNLKQRLKVAQNTGNLNETVLGGQMAGLIRNQDFVRLSTKYLGDEGHPRLHRLRECPRSYTLAYLYPRGSPLYGAANWYILHFLQHGLYAKWERDATHTVAMNRAFKVRQVVTHRAAPASHGSGQVQLLLDHLLVPFILLGGGLALAGAAFTCELLCSPRCSRSRERNAKSIC